MFDQTALTVGWFDFTYVYVSGMADEDHKPFALGTVRQ